jgi:hypothetical protein
MIRFIYCIGELSYRRISDINLILLVSDKDLAKFQADKEQKEKPTEKGAKGKVDDFLDKYAKFFDVETMMADMKKDLNTQTQSQSLFTNKMSVCLLIRCLYAFIG